MHTQRTQPETWPIDDRKLLPVAHQRAAFKALVEARDLLAEIAVTCKLLGATAFDGQGPAQAMSVALHSALLELDVALGQRGVVTFATPKE